MYNSGTEWCGTGNIAKSENEFGRFKSTDKCCKAHDRCKIDLDPMQTKFGLRNSGLFTR